MNGRKEVEWNGMEWKGGKGGKGMELHGMEWNVMNE
jgi:hypothetical protein